MYVPAFPVREQIWKNDYYAKTGYEIYRGIRRKIEKTAGFPIRKYPMNRNIDYYIAIWYNSVAVTSPITPIVRKPVQVNTIYSDGKWKQPA